MFERSRHVATSVLTVEEEAPGFWGPSTKVGNMKSASHVASLRASPRTSAALINNSVTTGSKAATLGFGIAIADRHPDVLMYSGVKSGFLQQNSTAVVWMGGGVRLGSDLAFRAWTARAAWTHVIVVARYGPSSSAGGADGLLSR